ncbi:YxlC family protein [Bacillus sp. SCS-151]|uniref:YxlC family protein n=1 Tax=Nanhaiella sioensis TaxID=3115293 RepID=UPI00397BB4C9
MTKNKVTHIDDKKSYKSTVEEVHKGLASIDHQFSIETPDLNWLEQKIVADKLALRKKFIRDLLIYILIILTVGSGLIVILTQSPAIFVALQLVVTAILPIIVYFTKDKQVADG